MKATKTWQVQEAKNKLSQLLKDAAEQGPQIITSHGREAGYVLSPADYLALTQPKNTLYEFFRASPLVGLDLDFERPVELAEVMDF